jgi:branched-chain amino acid transport system substrate-binding protein
MIERLVAAFATATLLSVPSLTAAKDTVRIVFIGPLTGGVAANGLGGRNSVDLAVKLRNADPRARFSYDLVVLDDECKPNVGVQVATKAASDNSIIGGVTHYCSTVAMGTVDVYHRFGLPVIIWGAVLPDVTYANDYREIHRVNGIADGPHAGRSHPGARRRGTDRRDRSAARPVSSGSLLRRTQGRGVDPSRKRTR